MAALDSADRLKIRKGLARYWSRLREKVEISGSDLLAAVNATDDFIDSIQGSYNSALPLKARTNLTAIQKTILFCTVAIARVVPGNSDLLRRLLGVGVN